MNRTENNSSNDLESAALRPVQKEDFSDVLTILKEGRDFQRKQGFFQWDDQFPDSAAVWKEIAGHKGYLLIVQGMKAGYVLIEDQEPAYRQPTACWQTAEPAAIFHRVALGKNFQGRGLGRLFLQACEQEAVRKHARSVRIDTHCDNLRMQHLLKKCGYRACGYVQYPFGSRLVYEKVI